jgi:hypothetical protein
MYRARVKLNEGVETKPTLKKQAVASIPPLQESQAHPSQMLIFRTLL